LEIVTLKITNEGELADAHSPVNCRLLAAIKGKEDAAMYAQGGPLQAVGDFVSQIWKDPEIELGNGRKITIKLSLSFDLVGACYGLGFYTVHQGKCACIWCDCLKEDLWKHERLAPRLTDALHKAYRQLDKKKPPDAVDNIGIKRKSIFTFPAGHPISDFCPPESLHSFCAVDRRSLKSDMECIGEEETEIQDELIDFFRKHCKTSIILGDDRLSKQFSDIIESSSIWHGDNYKNFMLPQNRTLYLDILRRSHHFSHAPKEFRRVKDIWDGLAALFKVVLAEDTTPNDNLPFPRTPDAVYEHASDVLQIYIEQYGRTKVTPYWHILVHHVPDMMNRNWIRIGAWATEAKHREVKLYSKTDLNYGKQSFPRQVLEEDYMRHSDESPPKSTSRSEIRKREQKDRADPEAAVKKAKRKNAKADKVPRFMQFA
jgi:hypothetical protein